MLKKELVEKLMEMAGGEYTKTQLNRMLKADLEKLYEKYTKESANTNKSDVENKSGDVQNSTSTANNKTNAKVIDITKYSNFKCHKNVRNKKPSANQLKLIKTLELNYKVRFDNVESATFGELSDRISACIEAIKQGKVKKRTAEEKIAKLKITNQKKTKAEVAVTTANDTINNSDVFNNLKNKFKDKTFRVKFIEYLKRMFS